MGRKALPKEIAETDSRRLEWAMALLPHFQKQGIKGFSMDRVAEALGASKATVYKVFRTREEILEIMIGQKLLRIGKFEEVLADKSRPFIARYRESVKCLSDNIGDISTKFLLDLKRYHPSIWEAINLFKEHAVEVLADFYEEGITSGEVRKMNPDILRLGDELYISALLDPDFLTRTGLSLQKAFDDYFELKLLGMLNPQ